MKLTKFMACQYSRPSGAFGRLFVAPLLNRSNAQSNAGIYKALEVERASRILEIGFGGGELIFRIAATTRDAEVHGLELSEAMIVRAQKKAARKRGLENLRLKQGTVDSLPYDDRYFDRICCVNTIYFWPDLIRSFAELARVMRPGGLLVLGYGSDVAMRKAGYESRGLVLRSAEQVSMALNKCGFQNEDLETQKRNKEGAFHISASTRET